METYHTREEVFNANVLLAWFEGKSCAEALNIIQDTDAWKDDKIPLSIIPEELQEYVNHYLKYYNEAGLYDATEWYNKTFKQENNMCNMKKDNDFRPYKKEELPDLVGKVVVHKIDGSTSLILSIYKEFISVGSGGLAIKSNVLLNDYTFKDGSVCGVKEEKFYSILELDVNKKYTSDTLPNIKYIYYDSTMDGWFFGSKHSILLTDKIIHTKFKEYVPETES